MQKTLRSTREDHLVAWLAAMAITIHIIESVVPMPLPGVKPGFANIVTLMAMFLFGWRIAVWVAVLRVLVGSILIGTFLTPTFMLSFAGSVSSLLALGALWWLTGKGKYLGLGPVGFSICASLAHMAGQFYCAYLMFIPHPGVFYLLPILMSLALLFGVVSGVLAQLIKQAVDSNTALAVLTDK